MESSMNVSIVSSEIPEPKVIREKPPIQDEDQPEELFDKNKKIILNEQMNEQEKEEAEDKLENF